MIPAKTEHPRSVRLMLAFVPFVLTYVVLKIVGRGPVASVLAEVVFLAPYAAGAVACAMVVRIARGAERFFWALLGACVFFLFLGESDYALRAVLHGVTRDPVTAWSGLLQLLPSCAFIALLVFMTRLRESSLPTRVRLLSDLAITAVGVWVVGWLYVIEPWYSALGVTGPAVLATVTSLAVTGVLVVAGALLLLTGLKRRGWALWERFVTLGIGLFGVSLLLWPAYYVWAFVRPSPLTVMSNAMMLASLSLVLIGAVARLESGPGEIGLRRLTPYHVRSRWLALVMHACAILAIPTMGFIAHEAGRNVEAVVAFSGAVAIALLLVVRNFSVAVEGGHLFERSVVEVMTGLYNERFFEERFRLDADIAMRSGQPLSLLWLDVDDLHALNAVRGHEHGDRVLRAIAAILHDSARDDEVAARVGGNEFALLLPGAGNQTAMITAERIRSRISSGSDCTVSIGVATFPQDGVTTQELRRAVRQAVEWAKRHAKDRVVNYEARRGELSQLEWATDGSMGATHVDAIKVLALAVDSRDPHMRYHSRSVSDLAWLLAGEMGFSEERRELLRLVALMHDVGKIGVADSVLRKTGPLSAAERLLVHTHCALGQQIVESAGLGVASLWVRSHHERWDGTGYPDGLRGPQIPVEARVLAVCDSFDAMTSNRPYRRRLTFQSAMQEIDHCMGTQFDPEVAEAFIRIAALRYAV